jgi:putative copper export protein
MGIEKENPDKKEDNVAIKGEEEARFASETILGYFRLGLFIILMILLAVAIFQFYYFAMDAISTLFEHEYRSLVQTGFVACVIAVVVYLLRAVIIKGK